MHSTEPYRAGLQVATRKDSRRENGMQLRETLCFKTQQTTNNRQSVMDQCQWMTRCVHQTDECNTTIKSWLIRPGAVRSLGPGRCGPIGDIDGTSRRLFNSE